jgi:hypothetical protein
MSSRAVFSRSFSPCGVLFLGLLLSSLAACNPTEDTGEADDKETCDLTLYQDADGDMWGVDTSVLTGQCEPVAGWVTLMGDCDDDDESIHPLADEACDGIDQDCDGVIDENPATGTTYYLDEDGDGYGVNDVSIVSCERRAPEGYASSRNDCDDDNRRVNPGQAESCTTDYDDDCDGDINEDGASGGTSGWIDLDGDGFGNAASRVDTCEPREGLVDNGDDCDDLDPRVFPGAPERCNGVDDDCDTAIDEDPAWGYAWYLDADGDGYGDPSVPVLYCTDVGEDGTVDNDLDCDDAENAVNPDAEELCNEVDDNCDGQIDEGCL